MSSLGAGTLVSGNHGFYQGNCRLHLFSGWCVAMSVQVKVSICSRVPRSERTAGSVTDDAGWQNPRRDALEVQRRPRRGYSGLREL